MKKPPHELIVSSLGDVLWVNGLDGSCLARFSKRGGIDVHNSATAQLAGASECLYCTHAPAGLSEWETFRVQVLEHHGIAVPADALSF
ncbi:hypothetical protein [Burkholderia cenocepacia]|uniref:hypothetical protein n=1 Tax=Burkholderia cenocepacia TaxID=95486 RepID=UPI0009B411EA|nr:hypothetical protein [Burkholderia cenocepacia]